MAMQMNRGPLKAEMNVTPMIDVLLVLLVVFILIQPLKKYGYEAEVPQKQTEKDPAREDDRTIVLEIISGNSPDALTLRINRRSITVGELPAQVHEIYKYRATKVLFIEGERDLEFRQLADVIDVVMKAEPALRLGLMPPRSQT